MREGGARGLRSPMSKISHSKLVFFSIFSPVHDSREEKNRTFLIQILFFQPLDPRRTVFAPFYESNDIYLCMYIHKETVKFRKLL